MLAHVTVRAFIINMLPVARGHVTEVNVAERQDREKICVTAERTTLTFWESVMSKLLNVKCDTQ